MFSQALRLHTSFRGFQLLKAMVGVLKKLTEVSDTTYGRLTRGVQMARQTAPACFNGTNDRSSIPLLGLG